MLGWPQPVWTLFSRAVDMRPYEEMFQEACLVAASWVHRFALIDTLDEVRPDMEKACLRWIEELSEEPLAAPEAPKE